MFESAKFSLKPGDAIVTAMGVGILSKKTRTYWYYIFKNRVARIRKSQLWEMVDIGSVEIKYGSNNKYRRLKTTNRSLNLSGLTNKKSVKFYLSKETLSKTIFNSSKKGDIVNLEKTLKYGHRVSGHFIQGHVDTTSSIKKIFDSLEILPVKIFPLGELIKTCISISSASLRLELNLENSNSTLPVIRRCHQ